MGRLFPARIQRRPLTSKLSNKKDRTGWINIIRAILRRKKKLPPFRTNLSQMSRIQLLPTRRARRIQGTERRDPRTRIAAKTWPTNAKTRSKGVERSAQRTEEMIETSVDIPLSSNVKMNGPLNFTQTSDCALLFFPMMSLSNKNCNHRALARPILPRGSNSNCRKEILEKKKRIAPGIFKKKKKKKKKNPPENLKKKKKKKKKK